MHYVIAILLPPLAILLCKKPFQAAVNGIIWLLSLPAILVFGVGIIVWIMCSIHAVVVCIRHGTDKRFNRLVDAIETRNSNEIAASK